MRNNNISKKWVEIADKDLYTCEYLLKKKKALLEIACFHLQQAFEKYLKALIAHHGITPQKTHDLVKLLNHSAKYNFKLIKWIDAAEKISPFSVIPRYPGEPIELDIKTVKKLIKHTKLLGDLVKELIKSI